MSRIPRRKVRPGIEGLEAREAPVGWFSVPYLIMIKAVREHQAEVAAAAFQRKHPHYHPAHHFPPPPPADLPLPFREIGGPGSCRQPAQAPAVGGGAGRSRSRSLTAASHSSVGML